MIKNKIISSPKVSVIVTTFNRKELLKQTLDSILSQTFEDFELIVVDNYSNYDFDQFIEGYSDPRIISFQNQNKGIIAVNRNFGIKKARGEYLAFCDDDDIWDENKLSIQFNKIEGSEFDLVYSDTFPFKSDKKLKRTNFKKTPTVYDMVKKNQISLSSVLVKNKGIHFPEATEFVSVEDYALWLELIKKDYRFIKTNEVLVHYRLNENSASMHHHDKSYLKVNYLLLKLLINNVGDSKLERLILKRFIYNYIKFFIKRNLRKLTL